VNKIIDLHMVFLYFVFMGRAWRIEYEGGLYHVLSRENERKVICEDETIATAISMLEEFLTKNRKRILI
jgi:hypothetical protein